MSTTLSAPIATFVQAMNAHDTDKLLTSLSDDAVIADDGHEYRGSDEVRAWSDQIIRDYQLTLEIGDVVQRDGETIVTTQTSGTFDGSPLPFCYHFVLAGDKIAAVRIEV
jgi:ketosteroid isomerase-like protein